MAIGQVTRVSLPYPSTWEVQASFGGRPSSLGTLVINNVSGNRVSGAISFRRAFIPIQGFWNENTRQFWFESPYASFAGTLAFRDDPQINLRHYVLRGNVTMKTPSIRAGETGTWTATTNMRMR
ncbi:hypothetical protein [Brevibacillus sp. NRS-1366]|uniref:hypothetical protein n=1 Tax=Brevibacillus sp. NRS-1366 TaxID=3233899 RepID=UPI003D244BCF